MYLREGIFGVGVGGCFGGEHLNRIRSGASLLLDSVAELICLAAKAAAALFSARTCAECYLSAENEVVDEKSLRPVV